MFGEFKTLYPDAEPDWSFLHLLRPDLIGCCIHAPKGCSKYQITGSDEVTEVPEIINVLRE
jgi:hypothetical protein